MPVPNFYDMPGELIKVEPDRMYQLATVDIPNFINQVADSVNRIVGGWNELKLGWVGQTAEEAQDFNDRWVATIRGLFGTDDDPSSGVLPVIASGVALAAMNYGQAEDVVTKMFRDLTAAYQGGSSNSDSSGGHRDVDGPVTEHN